MKTSDQKNDAQQWQNEVKRVAAGIRKRVLEHTIKSNGGYLSQACSSAEIFSTLYIKVMDLGKMGSMTGSLGQGISQAAGTALARKL